MENLPFLIIFINYKRIIEFSEENINSVWGKLHRCMKYLMNLKILRNPVAKFCAFWLKINQNLKFSRKPFGFPYENHDANLIFTIFILFSKKFVILYSSGK